MPPNQVSTSPFTTAQTFVADPNAIAANPTIPNSTPPSNGFNFKLFIPIFLILVAAIAGGSFLFIKSKATKPPVVADRTIPTPSPTPAASTTTVDSRASLSETVQSVFTKASEQDINEYISSAQKAVTKEESYQNYVLAFSRMKQVYTNTQDPQVELAMLQLKNYVTASTEYKESDFII
jgi:hypothetical protein